MGVRPVILRMTGNPAFRAGRSHRSDRFPTERGIALLAMTEAHVRYRFTLKQLESVSSRTGTALMPGSVAPNIRSISGQGCRGSGLCQIRV